MEGSDELVASNLRELEKAIGMAAKKQNRRRSVGRYGIPQAEVDDDVDTISNQQTVRRFSLSDFRFPTLKKVAANLSPLQHVRKRRNSKEKQQEEKQEQEISKDNIISVDTSRNVAKNSPWDIALDSANLRGNRYNAAKAFAEGTEDPTTRAAKFIQTIWRGHRLRKPKSDSLCTIRFESMKVDGLDSLAKKFRKPYVVLTVRNKWTSQIIYHREIPILQHTIVLKRSWALPGLDDACLFIFTVCNSRRFYSDQFICQAVVPFEHVRHAVVIQNKREFSVPASKTVKYKQIWPPGAQSDHPSTPVQRVPVLADSPQSSWPFAFPRNTKGIKKIKVAFTATVFTPEENLIDWFWVAVPARDKSLYSSLSGLEYELERILDGDSVPEKKWDSVLRKVKSSASRIRRRVSSALEPKDRAGRRRSSVVPATIVDTRFGGATSKYLSSSHKGISPLVPVEDEDRVLSTNVDWSSSGVIDGEWLWRRVFGSYAGTELNLYPWYGALHPVCTFNVAVEDGFSSVRPGLPSGRDGGPPISKVPLVGDSKGSHKAACDERSIVMKRKSGNAVLFVAPSPEKRNLWIIKLSRDLHKAHTRTEDCPICDGTKCPPKPRPSDLLRDSEVYNAGTT